MKQKNSEDTIRKSNGVMLILSLTSIILILISEMGHKYILIFLILIMDVMYYQAVTKLYDTIKKIANVVDQMVDGIISDKTMQAAYETDDGIFSKICHKLNKLYDTKALFIKRTKEEMSATHQLISDISHQVKTPVANLKMYTEMLEKRLDKGEELCYLRIMEEQANKLDFLMQSLIKMSRLETHIISLSIQSFKLLDIIASVLGGIVPKAEMKGIQLKTLCPPEITVLVDFKWTVEAIFNILENAVKYTGNGGSIQVIATPLESFVSLEIIDNGMGINQQEIPLIFKRFYRGDSVGEKEGIGLGLALARDIITMEKGYVSVTSEIGKGSDFRVMLLKGET